MNTVVGVSFKKAGKIYYFDPGELELKTGDYVIVETARGIEYAEVVVGKKEIADEEIVAPLKDVMRKATLKDRDKHEHNLELEKEAKTICFKKIKKHGLPMKLIDVEYTFDHNKIIFYFTADGRVDFRELVKDLASVFKTRIELRQIGVRDEAKMLGGLGPCGLPVCCATFLRDFQPISIKMAKKQNLSLNPSKISGLCGRLMCCLRYEAQTYKELKQLMPNIGTKIELEMGKGKVVDRNLVKHTIEVDIGTEENLEINVEDLADYDLT
ncbi:PSP1 domain-containing protein [Halanaerobium praevalens]|uniref:PSP1 domain protein n=1 Tax=Halanaerobium praevalens (strain ATCC 33744 / DSM 2228 / GSL) TaxID=572479 RepID=E3DRS4_HALPG|nr:stage 0 sporulation family protein [Halanaerobium praevalens]ADO78138.1 PSP1 domain protein [Halanaerobium praevalens DSM 2228]